MASYGGGTNLPTQRESLEMMDFFGQDRALKLCEIATGVVVAGELSLAAATRVDKVTRTNEWVDAHERLGRNR
jgi:hydroxymethylglutaryl-CoA reductase (NADPH)